MFSSETSTTTIYTPDDPEGMASEGAVSPKLGNFIERICRYKEERTRLTPQSHDLAPIVLIERDGTPLGIFEAPEVNKQHGLLVARAGFGGFGADTIIIVMDAHMAPIKPEEMEQYRPGEMQRQCDEEGACELGLMTDVLIFHRITRRIEMCEGNGETQGTPVIEMEMATVPYIFHQAEGQPTLPLRWASSISENAWRKRGERVREAAEDKTTLRVSGYIAESLFHAALTPSAFEIAGELRRQLPEELRGHFDVDENLRAGIDDATRAALTGRGFTTFGHDAESAQAMLVEGS